MDQQNPLAVLFIYHSPYHSPPFISFSLLISSLCQFINSYLPVSLSPFLSSFSTIISHFALPPFIHLQCDRVVLVTCPSRSQTATLSSWVRSAGSTPYCSEERKTGTNGCRLVHAQFLLILHPNISPIYSTPFIKYLIPISFLSLPKYYSEVTI